MLAVTSNEKYTLGSENNCN